MDLPHIPFTTPSLRRWVLVHGDREWVTVVLLLGVFVTLLVLGAIWPVQYYELLEETNIVQEVFLTLLSGVILLVSIVVAVASVGVSQELTTVSEQQERFTGAIEYRRTIEEQEGLTVTPAGTGEFLTSLLDAVDDRVDELDYVDDDTDDEELAEDLAALEEDIRGTISTLLANVRAAEGGPTDEFIAGMDFDSSRQYHHTVRLLNMYDDELSAESRERLEELQKTLQSFLVGQSYFKSLYYKREFSNLSRTLLIVSLPVILYITYVLVALDAGIFPEVRLFRLSPLMVFVSFSYAVALAPYVTLTSYVLRVATITARTVAAGPFVHGSDYLLD